MAQKILVICLDNLGDAVIASSVIGPLKKYDPGCEIGFWVKSYTAGLFEGHSALSYIHASDVFWDKSPGQKKGSLIPFFKTLIDIRKVHYDIVFILNTEWRRSFFSWLLRIPVRIGFNRRKSFFFLSHKISYPAKSLPPADLHCALLEQGLHLQVEPETKFPWLEVNPKLPQEKTLRFDFSQSNKIWVGIHPFSGATLRDWPLERWNDFIHTINTNFPQIGLYAFGTENQKKQFFQHQKINHVNFIVPENLGELKNMLGKLSLLIGSDSGLGHIAAALKTPVLSLFGPSNPDLWKPQGARVVVIKANQMSDISVDTVIQKTTEILDIAASV